MAMRAWLGSMIDPGFLTLASLGLVLLPRMDSYAEIEHALLALLALLCPVFLPIFASLA